MTDLIVTKRGREIFQSEGPRHRQIRSGQRVELCLLPNGGFAIRQRLECRWSDLSGFLKGRTNGDSPSIEKIAELTEPIS